MFEVKKNIKNRSVDVRGIYPNSEVYVQKWVTINGKRYLVDGVGKTKCTKEDKFDKEFGIELATVRAEINMAKDYEKILIGLTKQPEWRKEKQATKEDFNECFKKAMIEMQTAVENFNKRFGIKE